jgi:hypothetical protein
MVNMVRKFHFSITIWFLYTKVENVAKLGFLQEYQIVE